MTLLQMSLDHWKKKFRYISEVKNGIKKYRQNYIFLKKYII